MTILAVFRSRAQCMDYAGRLYKYGVAAQTVSAPKEAHIGCGLCVKFDSTLIVCDSENIPLFEAFTKWNSETVGQAFPRGSRLTDSVVKRENLKIKLSFVQDFRA